MKNDIIVNNFIIENEMLINTNEAVRFLGYNVSDLCMPDEEMMLNLKEAEEELIKVMNPQYVYKEIELLTIDDFISIDTGRINFTGKSIKKYLEKCCKAIICCITLSAKVDDLIDCYQKKDMLMALLIDASANASVEGLRRILENELQKKYKNNTIQSMFGFGYGDLNINIMPSVLEYLNTKESIDVSCNNSCILIPLKSVCGIIGIAHDKPSYNKKCDNSCYDCNLRDKCLYTN